MRVHNVFVWLFMLTWSTQSAAAPVLKIDPFEEPTLIKKQESILTGKRMSSHGVWNPELLGTMRSPSGAMANVDGEIIVVGEEVEGFLLVDVRERTATFEKYGKKFVISMDEVDSRDESP